MNCVQAMEALVDKGLALTIGVSNFTMKKLAELLAEDIRIKPAVNQGYSQLCAYVISNLCLYGCPLI